MALNNDKIFMTRWLLPVISGISVMLLSVICFTMRDVAMGIIVLLIGAVMSAYFVFFVPHSIAFDAEKMRLIYVFGAKSVRYSDIRICEREDSGIKKYPYGECYHIICEGASSLEVYIPSTREIDEKIAPYLTR